MFELKVGIIKREVNVIISNSTGGKEMQVNKVIYILLALFLGSFGIHKFYAGKKHARFPTLNILLDSHPTYISNY